MLLISEVNCPLQATGWEINPLNNYMRTIKHGVETIDRYEIGKETGFLDRTQIDNFVDELSDFGYVRKLLGTKIMISDDGGKRVEI